MRLARWALTAVGVATLLASLWYVQAPPRTAGDYRERSALIAEALRSHAETASLWVSELEDGNVTRRAASVALREAEADAAAAVSQFAAWDPRGRTRRLRADLTEVGNDVTEALARLRIAAEDGRWDALPALARPLPRLSRQLAALSRRADP